jgi:hypothetical protein
MNPEKTKFDSVTPSIFFGQLFKSRNIMHIVHLKTNSLAVHKTCEAYYTLLLDLTDNLIETNYGVTGKKQLDEIPSAKYINPVEHLNDLHFYVSKYKYLFKSQEETNIIDDILALISKTKYLLTLE